MGSACVSGLVGLSAAAGAPRSAEEVIAGEVARHRKTVASLKEPILGKDEKESLEQQLANVGELAQSHRVPAALHALLRVARYVEAQDFRSRHGAQIQEGMPALERDWAKSDRERAQQLATHARLAPRISSAVARALAESSDHEARIVHEASLVYGGQVGADAGYFYLGEARALMAFTLLCDALPSLRDAATPGLKPIAPRLSRLEKELLEAFGRDTASPQAAAFARANGALKLARELDAARSAFGALYQYLLAEQALGQARTPEATADPAALRQSAAELERRIGAIGADHTLGLAFVQMGLSALERAAVASDPRPLLANAQVLIERVVPAYLDVAGE